MMKCDSSFPSAAASASASTSARWDPKAIANEANDAFGKIFAIDVPKRQSCDDADDGMNSPLIPSTTSVELGPSSASNKTAIIADTIEPTESPSNDSAIDIRTSESAGATPLIPEDAGDVSDKDSSCTDAISGNVDLTWEEALEKAKVLGEPIIRAARAARANHRGEREDNLCNELLEVLRNGPGTKISSETYRKITSPLYVEGIENQPQWSIEPPTSLPDDDYQIDAEDPEKNWRTKHTGTKKYLSQWKKYADSPRAWPVLDPNAPNGIKLVSEPDKNSKYGPKHFQTEVTNPNHYEQHDFGCNWNFSTNIGWNQPGWLEWFWNWIAHVPMQANVVDIYHEPFFDGTAVPDGGYDLMLQDIEHLPTPRDMKDEETRLHWHETSTGLIHNMATLNEEVDVVEKKTKKRQRLPDFEKYGDSVERLQRLWVQTTSQGDLQRLFPKDDAEPAVYLRPVTLNDIDELLPIFEWHARNSVTSRYGEELFLNGVNGVPGGRGRDLVQYAIQKSIESDLPFIVAVLIDPPEKRNRPMIVGYALLERLSDYFSDSGTAELQVFVHQYHRRENIGTLLVDMILSLSDPDYTRKSNCPWVLPPGMSSYPSYEHDLDSVHCGIAFTSGEEGEDFWIVSWLYRFFNFGAAGFLAGLRSKKDNDKYVAFSCF